MKLRMYFYTAVYCAVIYWLSSQSHPPHPSFRFSGSDKLAHLFLYGGLTTVVSWGLYSGRGGVSPRVQWIAPILFAVLYGVTDEIHQLFVPERSFDLWDLVANAFGAILVQVILCGKFWQIRFFRGGAEIQDSSSETEV